MLTDVKQYEMLLEKRRIKNLGERQKKIKQRKK